MVTLGNKETRIKKLSELSLEFSKKFVNEFQPDETDVELFSSLIRGHIRFLFDNSDERIKEKLSSDHDQIIKIPFLKGRKQKQEKE